MFIRAKDLVLVAAFAVLAGVPVSLPAEEILFIGNSFTYGGPDRLVTGHGGIPKLVEAIAVAKGKTISTTMISSGGKTLALHLKQEATGVGVKSKPWDWVVLQEFSTGATHVGNPGEFFKSGSEFARFVTQSSPKAGIILYETWARPKASNLYSGVSTEKTFVDDRQMAGEIRENYSELRKRLLTENPCLKILIAPVGDAFALCRERYPGINLDWPDHHHASTEGSYLAALVIYSTIFQDSPKGAVREFFGTGVDAVTAARLQEIADEVVSRKEPPKASQGVFRFTKKLGWS